ncbi:MAG: hypothetical protein WDM70_09870 [Nitrosomonadales bacterium]
MDNLTGMMGNTTLNGSLNFNYSGERPKVQGELTLPVFDLRPFMNEHPDAHKAPPQSIGELYQELAKATFTLKDLNSADADLTLRVGQWLNLPGNVHDAMLQVKLEHGHLIVPLHATVADVTLSGSASADASVLPARFDLALGTHDSSLGNLAGLLVGMPDVKGKLSRLDLRITARGDRGSELMQSLDVQLNVENGKLSYGNGAGGRPVQFALDKLVIGLPAGKALYGETHGTLLDKTFSATLHGGSLTDIMQEVHTPIDFEMQAGSAQAQIHVVLQPPSQNSGTEAVFSLTAPHSGEIADWLGLKRGADAFISLSGNFHSSIDSWHLADFALQLEKSSVSADMLHTVENGRPLIKFKLIGDLIDADELQSLLPENNNKHPPTTATTNIIDIPILPQSINLVDANIEVRIKRISSKSALTVNDLHFDGRIRDGMMSESPFAANVAGNNFSGSIFLDFRTLQPHSVLNLSANALDIGGFLNKLGITSNIDAGIDHLHLLLDLHSSHSGKCWRNPNWQSTSRGGTLLYTMPIPVGKCELHSKMVSSNLQQIAPFISTCLDHWTMSLFQ